MSWHRPAGSCLLALCTIVCAHAQIADSASRESDRSVPRHAPVDSHVVSNLEEQRRDASQFVNQKLTLWKERLKLADWRISIVMVRRSELKPKTLGGTRWDK